MSEWSEEAVRKALTVARNHGFAQVELQSDGVSFQATLSATPPRRAVVEMPAEEPARALEEDSGVRLVTAHLVGYYQPSATPLSVGKRVTKGDTVGVIEALGLANEVESAVSGEVTRVLVEPGQSVEFGQPLAEVKVEA